jgi:tetratricopeptide (TPR) repeat protein
MAQKYFKSVEVLSFPTPPLADRVETRVEAAFREGQYEHALQVANQLVTPYAEVAVSVLNFLGASYVQMGDSLRGEICFNHIFKACPEYWRAYINYGTLCIAQKKYAQALHAFEKGFQLSPPVLWETLLTLTLLYIQTQQTELAKQCLAWIRVTHEQYPMLVPQSIVDKANMFWNHYGVHA